METLKKLRRLAKQNDRGLSFDLKDGYHCVGIDPDFQKLMQFDVHGELYQCSALLFRWSDSSRIFVKFVKVLEECLRSPTATRDRADLQRLPTTTTQRRWEVRRRAGGAVQRDRGPRGERVLPYMDDFLLLASSEEEAYELQRRVERVLNCLGLQRNVMRGQLEPVQIMEHLGLKAFGDLEWWKRLQDQCKRNEQKIWRSPTRAKLHTDASLYAWGGVLNLKLEARGVWRDELRHLRNALGAGGGFQDGAGFSSRAAWKSAGSTHPGGSWTRWRTSCGRKALGGTVVVPYWPGQSWFRELEVIAGEARRASAASQPVLAKGARLEVYWPLDDDWCGGTVIEVTEENNDVAPVSEWTSALRERWRASEETVRLYLAALLQKGGIQATSMQPYLSAINNYHEDMGLPGPAKGRSVTRAVKALTLEQEDGDQLGWLQACTYVVLAFTSFGRSGTGTPLQQENVLMDEEGATLVLTREKGRSHKLKKRQLSIPSWGVERLRELLEFWTRTQHPEGCDDLLRQVQISGTLAVD
ncbi:hypothetical protein CYMTET_34727 [Cymbomonas tetramitiformis]|uniref:Reverse transcriptase domain-containing protein n=1 Tax=Cymbomonas tetramitiformis TaxID=36881 RepID=A0AAE0FB32_9CHLO|nr:hypothetical protein CYMTET_34727 [Cymbomonas tetramitiformis]